MLLFDGCWFFCQAEDGIRYLVRSRGLGDVYKRQALLRALGLESISLRELAAVLLRGLARDPAQRFPDATSLIAALSVAAQPSGWQQLGLQFASIPAGPFTFGEGPSAHLTNLPPYQLTLFPITNAQFAAFIAATSFVTQAEREGAQGFHLLPVTAADYDCRFRCAMFCTLRNSRDVLIHKNARLIGYMNFSVIARDMSGACRTCFFSTMSSL